MFLEATNLYFKTSKNAMSAENKTINKSLKLQLFITLVIPIVFTFISFAIGQFGNDYVEKLTNGENKFCLVRKGISLYSFYAPIFVIVSYNLFVIIKVTSFVYKSSSDTTKSGKNSKQLKATLKATILMIPCLGITWFWKLFYSSFF